MKLQRGLLIWLLTVLFILYLFKPCLALDNCEQIPDTNVYDYNEVILDLIDDFELYTALINDVIYYDKYILPVHGKSLQEAYDYLEPGFESEIKNDIINYYLQYQEDLQQLVIIPTDSVPIITGLDIGKIQIVNLDDTKAVLQRIYNDCYASGQTYIYTINLMKTDKRWKINTLSLEPVKISK